MIIEEVEIYKVFDCKHLLLRFEKKRPSSVYVVQNNDDPNCNPLLTLAVQLICSAKYADFGLCNDLTLSLNTCEGFVRMKFILPISSIDNERKCGTQSSDESDSDDFLEGPMTSQAADKLKQQSKKDALKDLPPTSGKSVQKFILIEVCRDFRKQPNEVTYSINNGPQQNCSLAAFHGRFCICLDYMLPLIESLSEDFYGNWLELLSSDLNERWNQSSQLEDPFEKFVFLYRKYGCPEQHILSEITRAHLSSTIAIEALQKTYVIKILRDTRGIFEYITAAEYTVFFYIPHHGRDADLLDVHVEDLNFEHMTTYIEDNSKSTNHKFLWTEAQPAIKDMLLIAFQISLSFQCKQQIIYLNNLEAISNYQAIQFATIASFQQIGIAKPAWSSKNYLQRIVDVCIASGTTAIIEFPGGTPLHPVNAYLLKSFKIVEADKTWLSLRIMNDERYSFQFFLECLQDGLESS